MQAILFYDVVLWVHIMAVVIGFGGVFTYPLWYSTIRDSPPEQRAGFHRLQGRIGKLVISPGLVVIVLAGAYLASDRDYWSESWVTIPLIIAIVIGGLGGAYFSPRETKLAELREGPEYDRLVAQVRNVGYFTAFLVLVAAFLMVTKPGG